MKRLLTTFVMALCLFGCSENPSESLEDIAQAKLDNEIRTQSQGKMHVASFKKLDGQDMEVFGVKGKEIQFEATVIINTNGWWLTGGGYSGFLKYQFVPGAQQINTTFSPGAVKISGWSEIVISGKMRGKKTDNGWQFAVVSSDINPGQVYQNRQ